MGAGGYGSFGTGDKCQEDEPTGNRFITATVGRDLKTGSPLRLTGTCTVILADTTVTENIGNVWTQVQVRDTFPYCCDNGNEGIWNANMMTTFTKHRFNSLDWPAVEHGQIVGINVVITFQ